ncbi:hypothetical protein BGW80DRAFT_1266425 [Lactifluus volemus]|nr:hypothetical protein BGW80DRAFT_1266425 [Lactifluus volemus]
MSRVLYLLEYGMLLSIFFCFLHTNEQILQFLLVSSCNKFIYCMLHCVVNCIVLLSCFVTRQGICHVVGALSTGNMSYIHYLNDTCVTTQAHYRLGALSCMQWRTEAKFVSENLSHARTMMLLSINAHGYGMLRTPMDPLAVTRVVTL